MIFTMFSYHNTQQQSHSPTNNPILLNTPPTIIKASILKGLLMKFMFQTLRGLAYD